MQALEDEDKMTPEQLAIKNVGKQVEEYTLEARTIDNPEDIVYTRIQAIFLLNMCLLTLQPSITNALKFTHNILSILFQDPKRHLEESVDSLMTSNIVQCLGAMLDTVTF